MNKYEKELEDIKSIILPIELLHLQELVELHTPKKVIKINTLYNRAEIVYNFRCDCRGLLQKNFKFCPNCGKSLKVQE